MSAPAAPTDPVAPVLMPWYRKNWAKVFGGGLCIWVFSIFALAVTNDNTIVPSVIFAGSFLVPMTFVVWAFEREQFSGASVDGQRSQLTIPLLVTAVFGAGLVGVIFCALVETLILPTHPILYFPGVAVIEETTKAVLVVLLARKLGTYFIRDGMVLGAAVGFGFASFESCGYAFNAVIASTNRTADVFSMVETELTRALLAPVGHGLWTALIGGALFAAARNGKLRMTWSVAGWWLVAVVLHAMWDLSDGLAIWLTFLSTGAPINVADIERGVLADPTGLQAHFDAVYSFVFFAGNAIVGLFLVRRMWIRGRAVVEGYPYGPEPEGAPAAADSR